MGRMREKKNLMKKKLEKNLMEFFSFKDKSTAARNHLSF
jgi:hypothetical protein